MSRDLQEVAAFPLARIVIADGTVTVDGRLIENSAGESDLHRLAVHTVARDVAQDLGRPVRAIATEEDTTMRLVVHLDGTATDIEDISADERTAHAADHNSADDETHIQALEASLRLAADNIPTPSSPLATERTDGAVPSRRALREERASFLTREQVEEPATVGVRGLLTRAGVRMSPNATERMERADVLAVSQHWPGPRTIAIVNGKGGASKTPATILLAAVFARYGGAGVLTWDNNQTRGTLGWRTDQGPHEATLLDLLPQTDRLLSPAAQSADLAHYVHHQTRDRFDVLRSKPMALAHEQRVEPGDVDAIHAVAAKYYRLIFIDSGNDESDPMWLRMIDHTDQLVVATTTRDDHAEAGALLLEGLADRDEHSADLARKAVVVVSQADAKATRTDIQRLANGYQALARDAVTIPFDPTMVDGVLRYGALHPGTQRAWLAAGAAVARGL